jgi:Zn-dependent oligopeptidase
MSQNTQSAAIQNNPLVNPPKTKFNMHAWDEIKPEHFLPAMRWAMNKARANLRAIRAVNPDQVSFTTVVEPFESFNTDMARITSALSYYTNNSTTDELDDLEKRIGKHATRLYTKALADKNIYTKIEAVYNNQNGLSTTEKRLTELQYKEFKSGPVSLSDEQRKTYLALSEKLSEKSQTYSKNLMIHTNKNEEGGLKVVITKSEITERLTGVSEDLISFFTEADTGDVVIGAIPESMDILEQCTNRETRRQVYLNWTGRGNTGAHNNSDLTSEIHQLKQEMAQLFGYDNVVEKTIRPDNRAAGTPENVWNILHRMRDIGYRASVDVYQDLLAIAEQDGITALKSEDVGGDEDKTMQLWDAGFYMNILEQQKGGIDPEEEKKYFEVGAVMDGLQRSMKRRYGLNLEETDDFQMPSEDMQVFYSKKNNGEVDGIFIVDLYQRDNKRGGAWMDQMRPAGFVDGEWQVPITLVNCNYAVDKAAQYISFYSVETLYHEWGHGAHGHNSQKTKYQSLNSIEIAWDAVELPSQFNEIFAAHRRHFNSYARHRDTGETMPKKLYDKLIEKKPSTQLLRQNQLCMLDMQLYSESDKISNVVAFNKAVNEPTQLLSDKTDNATVNGFSHIMAGGYSAGYYSYLYADFMVAAIEDLFEKHGQKAVNAFKREFTSVGCMKDASEAFDNIYKALGEEVKALSPDGYLRKNGYGKYLDQADAEGTSGEGVNYNPVYTRPKIAP